MCCGACSVICWSELRDVGPCADDEGGEGEAVVGRAENVMDPPVLGAVECDRACVPRR